MKFYLIFPFLILMQLAIFAADTNMKDIANWSKEQMDAYVGIGTYNTKEYDEFPAKFKNNIWYWYGIKNYQDEKYSQSLLCFETYTYSARDLHDGQIASGNAALQLGLQKGNRPFAYAAVAYEHAIKGFPDNYRARAGAIIANAMLDQYQDVEKQVGEAVALMNRQKNDGTRSALLRAILPAMIFTNQRNEFASVVSKLGDDDLKAYPDLALNYAKGVYNFKIESEYKRADAMLKALGLGAESVLKKNGILVRPPPKADANSLHRSRAEKIATVVFDINAVGWNDIYDAGK
jgi:hypothetical protein